MSGGTIDALTQPLSTPFPCVPPAAPAKKNVARKRRTANTEPAGEVHLFAAPAGTQTLSGTFVGEGEERRLNDTPVPIETMGHCTTLGAFLNFAWTEGRGCDGISFQMEADSEGNARLWGKACPFTKGKIPFFVDLANADAGSVAQALSTPTRWKA